MSADAHSHARHGLQNEHELVEIHALEEAAEEVHPQHLTMTAFIEHREEDNDNDDYEEDHPDLGEAEALIGAQEHDNDADREEQLQHRHNHHLDRRVVRKLDFILLPFLALLFLLNSLDKSNIGNAETAGFTRDTGLSPDDVNYSMAVFFAVFVLLQPVGAALGRCVGMRRYVPACMSLWGLSTVLHVFVRRRWHLILLRVAVAVLESGFYPTTVSYMSQFYTRYEFALRLGFFYGMSAVAGVLGGVLSFAIFSNFSGNGDSEVRSPPVSTAISRGWKSWEWLFLIEGCTTVSVALLGFFWLPRSAPTAWFLNTDEKSWAEQRIRLDTRKAGSAEDGAQPSSPRRKMFASGRRTEGARRVGHPSEQVDGDGVQKTLYEGTEECALTADSGLSAQDVLSAVFSYKIWLLLAVNILSAIPATAFGVLLPILVKALSPALHLSPAALNLLSAPPFAFGAVVLYAFVRWSDRSRQRILPILASLLLLLLGLGLGLAAGASAALRYGSLCVVVAGSFVASPLTIAWLANNTPRPGKRAVLLGINGWGNLAGCAVAVLFTPSEAPSGYARSFAVLFACVGVACAGFAVFRMLLVRENRFRDDVVRTWSAADKEAEDRTGDASLPDHHHYLARGCCGPLSWIARVLGCDHERRGDEKMTFRYSL